MDTILLVDAFSLAFRAYYSYPLSLRLPDGRPINVVFGFSSLLFKAIDDLKPTHVCVCFDRPEPTFRHERYPDYKAHRPPPPEDFKVQVPLLKQALADMSIPMVEQAGYEADDIIGAMSLFAETHEMKSLIMTGDHDSFQLVSDKTSVVMNKKGVSELICYTPDLVKEKYQLSPQQIIDYKALKGDSSDNIPGVPGVGDKTATKLLHDYETLEGIYENIDKIASKSVKTKLETNKAQAFLSYELATIVRDIPLEHDITDYLYSPDWPKVVGVFKENQFKSLVSKYSLYIDEDKPAKETANGHYQLIKSVSELTALLPQLEKGFAIDLETTSLTALEAEIVGISLSVREKEAVYIACNSYLSKVRPEQTLSLFESEVPVQKKIESNPFLETLKPLLENEDIPKYTHHGKYEQLVLSRYKIRLRGVAFDSMLAAFVLFPGDRVGLKDVVSRHLGIEMMTYESVTGKGKQQIPFRDVPIDQAVSYAGADADFTLRLKNYFEPMIKDKKLESLYFDIDLPAQTVLAHMEKAGVTLDRRFLKNYEDELVTLNQANRKKIIELAGVEFNVNSTKQLAEILFERMQIPPVKKTKTGYSTDSSVLEKLAPDHEIAAVLLRYRTLEKLLNTYVTALPSMVLPSTGKVHTSYNQTVAITGRLSSQNPNLQNIPIRTAEGQKVRQAFVPSSSDHVLLSVDYSQIELRLMAHFSEDDHMVQSFQAGEDIHTSTAAMIHHVAIDAVTKEQRYHAKSVNFGIIYGTSAFGLSENLNIPQKEAKQIIDSYFETFPKIKSFIDATILDAREKGYVQTLFGRYRYLPEINDRLYQRRQFSERAAVNTILQGTAADMMKLAMVNVFHAMCKKPFKSRMVLQVHDELVFDVLKSEREELIDLVTKEMESVVQLKVPLKVDTAFGQNWAEL